MKNNVITIFLSVLEYIALIAPTAAYAIYTYVDTLQHTMSTTSKGCFWALIAVALIVGVVYAIFRKHYDRYVQGYVQQKTDLETDPNNELLIKKVAEKKAIIENIDYVIILIPVLIAMTVVAAFQSAIEQFLVLLCVLAGSIAAKIGLHLCTVYTQRKYMIKTAKEG